MGGGGGGGGGGIAKRTCAYQGGRGVIFFTKNCVRTRWMTP